MKGIKIKFTSANSPDDKKDNKPDEESSNRTHKKRDPKAWRKRDEFSANDSKKERTEAPTLKYDFSSLNPTAKSTSETSQGLGLIISTEELHKCADSIFEHLTSGNAEFAQNKIYQLDMNINSWLSGLPLNLTSSISQKDKPFIVPTPALGGEEWLKSQRRDLEKYEDGDYKGFLTKMRDKNLLKQKRILTTCNFCLENAKLKEFEVLAMTQTAYILQPKKTSFPGRHFLIVPTTHVGSTIQLEKEEYEELRALKEKLVLYLRNVRRLDSIVLETAFNFKKAPHARLEIFGVEEDFTIQAPLFFDQAFEDLGDLWDTHRKGQKLTKDKGGVIRQIPPNFEYCAAEWDDNEGLFNVIEDAKQFGRNFFYEVLGSMMDIDPMIAKAPKDVDDETMKRFKVAFRHGFKINE